MTPEAQRELAELLRRLQQDGNPAALREIIEQTWRGVLSAARALVGNEPAAEDLTQEVFLVFCQRYRTIRDPSRLCSWLYRVANRKARDHRPNPREPLFDPEVLQLLCETGAMDESPFDILCKAEREEALRKACATLSPRLRRCVELVWGEHCTSAEAASRMGVSVETIWQYLSRAIAHISRNRKTDGDR